MAVRRLEIGAFGGPELIRVVEDAALPAPGPGEVRIRVEASSLVFTDVLIRRNLYPVLKLTLPLTLGYDLIGRTVSPYVGAVWERKFGLTDAIATYLSQPPPGTSSLVGKHE